MPDNPGAAGIPKNSLVLGLFALLAAMLLAAVHQLTADRIQQQQLAAERSALGDVLPAQWHDNDLLAAAVEFGADATSPFRQPGLLTLSVPRRGYIARKNGDFAGAIIPVDAPDGYNGRIALLVGVLADGTISGVRVTAHRETPGLGDKIDAEISDWILTFNGRSLDDPPLPRWQVVKDGGDFDQLVGATVTPRAVVGAVRRALQFFESNRGQLAEQQ